MFKSHCYLLWYTAAIELLHYRPCDPSVHTSPPPSVPPFSNSWLSFLHWWLQQKSDVVRGRVEETLAAQWASLAQGCLQLLTVGANPAVLHFLVQLAGLSVVLSRVLVCGLLRREPVGHFDPVLLLMGRISLEASMELLQLLCSPDTEPGMQRCVVDCGWRRNSCS